MSANLSDSKFDRIERLLSLDPNNPHLLREGVESAIDAGKFDQALVYLNAAQQNTPDDPQLMNLRGLLGMRTGDLESARSAFQSLIDSGVNAPGIRYNLSYTLMFLGLYADVPTLLEDALDIIAEAPDAPALKVRALHCLGQIDEAIAVGLAFLELKPNDANVSGLLSTLYIDSEDLESAAKYAEIAIQSDAKIPEAWVTRGTLELAEQRDAKAVEYFDRALELTPNSGRAWAGRGLARVLDMKFDKGIEDLQQATRFMPEHIGTWHALGWTQIFGNDIEGAKKTFEHALAMDHNFSESHGALAVIAVMQGNKVEAEAATRRSLGLDKHSFSGLFARSLLLNSNGRPDLAQKIIEGVMNKSVLPDGRTLRQSFVNYMSAREQKSHSKH